jgi:hypothetical protein
MANSDSSARDTNEPRDEGADTTPLSYYFHPTLLQGRRTLLRRKLLQAPPVYGGKCVPRSDNQAALDTQSG